MPQPKFKPIVRCLHCPQPAATRDICQRCYGRLVGRVRRGETTWESLEAEGAVGPVTARRARRDEPAEGERKATEDDEPTEAELEALIAEQLPTMPGWDPGDE